jgi:hypothetical protein
MVSSVWCCMLLYDVILPRRAIDRLSFSPPFLKYTIFAHFAIFDLFFIKRPLFSYSTIIRFDISDHLFAIRWQLLILIISYILFHSCGGVFQLFGASVGGTIRSIVPSGNTPTNTSGGGSGGGGIGGRGRIGGAAGAGYSSLGASLSNISEHNGSPTPFSPGQHISGGGSGGGGGKTDHRPLLASDTGSRQGLASSSSNMRKAAVGVSMTGGGGGRGSGRGSAGSAGPRNAFSIVGDDDDDNW